MKRIISILCTALLLLVPLTACRGAVPPPVPGTSPVSGSGAASQVQQPDTTAQSRVPGGRLTFHTVYPRAQAGVTYAVSAGQLYFRVGLWDREYFAQVNVEYGGSGPVVSATTLGDAGWLLAAREAATNEISVVIFGKDLPELSVYTIRLRQQMHVTHLFCSFLNAWQGFLFVFGDQPGQPGQHFVLLKTTDGGRSWNPVRESGTPTAAPGEIPTLARFATEQVGMVCYGYSEAEGSAPELSARTYLTDDGGRTWQSFPVLSYGFAVGTEEGEYHTDGYDLTYVDGKYLLRVIARNGTGGYIETPYLSSDLQTWEPYNPFPGLDGWGEAYLPVLKQRLPYYHTGAQAPRYLTPDFTHYAMADLDRDGRCEVLLKSPDLFLILREENGTVYGFPFDRGSTDRITEDGICYWTRSTHVGQDSGAFRLRFSKDTFQCIEIYRISENGLEEIQHTMYSIYGASVTKGEMMTFLETMEVAAEVVWHPMPELHFIEFETGKW